MQISESLRRMHLDVVSLLAYYRQSYDYDDHNTDVWLPCGLCGVRIRCQNYMRLTTMKHLRIRPMLLPREQ